MWGMDNARYLNSLPTSHWVEWHTQEDFTNERLDHHRAAGLSVERAYDAAIADAKDKTWAWRRSEIRAAHRIAAGIDAEMPESVGAGRDSDGQIVGA